MVRNGGVLRQMAHPDGATVAGAWSPLRRLRSPISKARHAVDPIDRQDPWGEFFQDWQSLHAAAQVLSRL